jgi:hypothetical protein
LVVTGGIGCQNVITAYSLQSLIYMQQPGIPLTTNWAPFATITGSLTLSSGSNSYTTIGSYSFASAVTAVNGQSSTILLSSVPTGIYKLVFVLLCNNQSGQVILQYNTNSGPNVTLYSSLELYNSTVVTAEVPCVIQHIGGNLNFIFTIIGKNARSSSYYCRIGQVYSSTNAYTTINSTVANNLRFTPVSTSRPPTGSTEIYQTGLMVLHKLIV